MSTPKVSLRAVMSRSITRRSAWSLARWAADWVAVPAAVAALERWVEAEFRTLSQSEAMAAVCVFCVGSDVIFCNALFAPSCVFLAWSSSTSS